MQQGTQYPTLDEYIPIVLESFDYIDPSSDPNGDNWRLIRFLFGDQYEEEFAKTTIRTIHECHDVTSHLTPCEDGIGISLGEIENSGSESRKKRNWSSYDLDDDDEDSTPSSRNTTTGIHVKIVYCLPDYYLFTCSLNEMSIAMFFVVYLFFIAGVRLSSSSALLYTPDNARSIHSRETPVHLNGRIGTTSASDT